ncbi:MAG TPA: hypothetical protein ENJ18_12950 [Nannocystis exedens]|nr:hypothetical protein [Nannocystis exedens]
MMPRTLLFLLLSLPLAAVSCKSVPGKSGTRESGQSRLMDDSFAAKNACNPNNHKRPFIIEWDATDMSSFESYAANDVVIVRYEGCHLEVLDECRNDSIRGEQGAYKPVEWTSGSLEKLEIASEGELYAKLPLGEATLGGRVRGGEKFSMEYYVAGTRNASRDAVYRADIDDNPGCEDATHFVYGYNLGAFALGSVEDSSIDVGGSIYGFGAGGNTSKSRKADKKGGDLGVCQSDSATEVNGCKAPIRLSLRKIREGEDPKKGEMSAPETDASLNAAGQIGAKIEMSDEAQARYDSATLKMNSKDGNGCLAELDGHDVLDPKHQSTDAKSGLGLLRAQCLMLAGKCRAGKVLARKSLEVTMAATMGPEQIDKGVDAQVMMYCQGKMQPRDAVIKALFDLQQGAYITKKKPAECASSYKTIKKLKGKVKPKDEDDTQIIGIDRTLWVMAPGCFAKAGDCERAWKAFTENYPQEGLKNIKDADERKKTQLASFESMVGKCKGKIK